MDLNDNGNEWDACISLADKEEEVKRLAVRSLLHLMSVHSPEAWCSTVQSSSWYVWWG